MHLINYYDLLNAVGGTTAHDIMKELRKYQYRGEDAVTALQIDFKVHSVEDGICRVLYLGNK